jgi:uncharacterized membrane protein YedE/YeeE
MPVGAALAPVGVSVIVGAFQFGIGIQLDGGCGSGTLYTMGQGQVDMPITLLFFVVGAALGSAHLHCWLVLPGYGHISLIETYGWLQSLLLQLIVRAAIYALVRHLELKRLGSAKALERTVPKRELTLRLIHGPWPLSETRNPFRG